MNHLEDAASKAEDTLADYETMRDDMVSVLRTLLRGDGGKAWKTKVESSAICMIDAIEYCLFALAETRNVASYKATASAILEALDNDNRSAAQQAIDNHFSEYLARERNTVRAWKDSDNG